MLYRIVVIVWIGLISISHSNARVVINEFVSSNGTVLADEDGEFSDWIELFNTGESAIDLSGYGLSDNVQRPFKWVFPQVEIAPGDYLLVWASNKDRRVSGSPLHTNFAISAAGEPLTLVAPDGSVVDYIPPIGLARDEAYARIPDGSEVWVTTFDATPGSANVGFLSKIDLPPEISVASGFHTSPLLLSLWHEDPTVTILYTLDGSEPRSDRVGGQFYWYKNNFPEQPGDPFGEFLWGVMQTFIFDPEDSLRLTPESIQAQLSFRATTNQRSPEVHSPLVPPYTAVVLRARAVREGAEPGPIASATLFLDPVNDVFAGDLPVLSILLDSADLFDYYNGIYTAGFLF
ncbi:MAG: lamin tail domain-containing protein, partial [Verrucomicrobia bacterium]|nr:lamin tail domain-containing protein [Verrucomicrobiota bacterium]